MNIKNYKKNFLNLFHYPLFPFLLNQYSLLLASQNILLLNEAIYPPKPYLFYLLDKHLFLKSAFNYKLKKSCLSFLYLILKL